MTSDKAQGWTQSLKPKKSANRNKPGVVLCGSMDVLRALAQLNPKLAYQKHRDEIFFLVVSSLETEAFEKLSIRW